MKYSTYIKQRHRRNMFARSLFKC